MARKAVTRKMRTSATGIWTAEPVRDHRDIAGSNRRAGFTLLELLVVVVLIGLVLGLAQLKFSRNLDDLARNEARRYATVLGYTKEYSAYSGRVLSLRLDKAANSYYFYYVDPVSQKWDRLLDNGGNKLLGPHRIDRRVAVSVAQFNEGDGDVASGASDADDDLQDSATDIQIALITPFAEFRPSGLVLKGETRDYIVTTNEFNDIAIEVE